MCGISGIINQSNRKVNQNELKSMNDLISHRGPDDEGYYFEKNFAFGHRRLSILDLSADGHQPMSYLDEKYTITYNGEVYNYLEIRKELEKDGYIFNSHTDTEVILASYDKWGEACVNRFNGMWAFALYDKEREIIFCSRDRFGIKPFYYTKVDEKFVFGSEIKQLLEFYPDRYVNKEILIDYIVTRFQEHTNETFFDNIYKLEQSHNLVYNLKDETFEIKRFYEVKFHEDKNASEKYESELKRAIQYRLRSDVKVGTCLSGGLDSSTVAALASKEYSKSSSQKFVAIHAKSSEKVTDESMYAEQVSKSVNLDLKIIEPSTLDFIESIEKVIEVQEEPFGSPSIFMQYFVMEKAKEEGCTVMLDGQGGDETLLGYEKYYPSAYLDILKQHGFWKMLTAIKKSNTNNEKMSLKWILKYSIGGLFASLRKAEHKRQTSFMKPYTNQFSFLNGLSSSYKNIHALQKFEINYTNLPILLRYEDKNSMYHSIEARLPFIDYRTLETALNIDISVKIKDGWTKYILRKIAEKYLPKDVVWRKNKLGFNAPDDTWLDAIDEKMKNEIKNSYILERLCTMDDLLKIFDKIESRLRWRLYNIAVWERVYNVKIK